MGRFLMPDMLEDARIKIGKKGIDFEAKALKDSLVVEEFEQYKEKYGMNNHDMTLLMFAYFQQAVFSDDGLLVDTLTALEESKNRLIHEKEMKEESES